MSYVILDLEWNASYSRKTHKYINEIIEFGAVKTDDASNVTDKFSMLIKPQIGKRLSSWVKDLTHITNEELKNGGCTFMHAVSSFSRFLGDSTMLTWGTTDIHALIENYDYFCHQKQIPFLKSYCNVQEYCENALKSKKASSQMGLSACAELLSVSFDEGEQHRAFADAELTLKCLKKLIADFPLEPFTVDASNPEFYDRILFKTHYITDITNPELDKSQLYICCDVCGKKAKRVTKWKIRNKSFSGEFLCKSCGRRFVGRISFKKKYDGIVIRKRRLEIDGEKEQSDPPDVNIPADS